jgi:hypothetical protein
MEYNRITLNGLKEVRGRQKEVDGRVKIVKFKGVLS